MSEGKKDTVAQDVRILVLFDNYTTRKPLEKGWGFSCLVQSSDYVLLFDTGADGPVLLKNMDELKVDAKLVDSVFISHNHWDHTGGLEAFLKRNPYAGIMLLKKFASSINGTGGKVSAFGKLSKPEAIAPGFYTTGEMGDAIPEHSLLLDTEHGIVVVTGCSHPGISQIVDFAAKSFNKRILLAMGGFHLKDMSDRQINRIIDEFHEMGVTWAAPTHCSGDNARRLFKKGYKDQYIELGAGTSIEISKLA